MSKGIDGARIAYLFTVDGRGHGTTGYARSIVAESLDDAIKHAMEYGCTEITSISRVENLVDVSDAISGGTDDD